MANREELLIIRAARAGQAAAQLKLGKRYLFGGTSLPKSLPTALYWLDRAAQQDERDAWLLIGSHVPFETVQQASQPAKLCVWYERAFDAGVMQAGLVLAKLLLSQVNGAVGEPMRQKALRALQAAAQAGIAEAQWLLAQHISRGGAAAARNTSDMSGDNAAMLEWAKRAAKSGVVQAQYALADHAWATGEDAEFLHWALPLVRGMLEGNGIERQWTERDLGLLSRCAHALFQTRKFDPDEVVRLWEIVAQQGDREAQCALGLWFARMDVTGRRVSAIPGLANYKKAIRWLSLAADQGLVDAWYALSRIYLKPECSQRSLADAQRYLEKAAQAGHGLAQLELGSIAWRNRRNDEWNDVRAAYWLQKAAAQGIGEAQYLLDKIAARTAPAEWAQAALGCFAHRTWDQAEPDSLLAARIELAVRFGLARNEALLIDLPAADQGHCLVVDIRAYHPHSKRRLILVQTAEERAALNRIVRLFEQLDCGPDGPEGNYRQRLYRLRALLSQ
ncbi:MAG TPA: tetratricopeptide repeat protein [Noviherbaspirillum sp.]